MCLKKKNVDRFLRGIPLYMMGVAGGIVDGGEGWVVFYSLSFLPQHLCCRELNFSFFVR